MKYSIKMMAFAVILVQYTSCTPRLSKTMANGGIALESFSETVRTEGHKGLIFVPVIIEGREYRFLFDTGAPFSISKQIQKAHEYKVLNEGTMIDSDDNKARIEWVKVDSISIGEITFTGQSAFVTDFDANAALGCLEVDGIIGSNLMRHCNWSISPDEGSITFFKNTVYEQKEECVDIPFRTDRQFNIFIDLNIGSTELKNVLVDYGSNGPLSVGREMFTALRNKGTIGEAMTEMGIQQTGIIGDAVELQRELTFTDSIIIGQLRPDGVMLQTGGSALAGNALLSRFNVTIDWQNKVLCIRESLKEQAPVVIPGFRLGHSDEKGVFIRSVIVDSDAYNKGIRPEMLVTRLDGLDFENGDDFCAYIMYEWSDSTYVECIDEQGGRVEYIIESMITPLQR